MISFELTEEQLAMKKTVRDFAEREIRPLVGELDQLPAEIESIESSIAMLQQAISDPDFYAEDQELVQDKLRELGETEAQLEQRMERWSELEELQASLGS